MFCIFLCQSPGIHLNFDKPIDLPDPLISCVIDSNERRLTWNINTAFVFHIYRLTCWTIRVFVFLLFWLISDILQSQRYLNLKIFCFASPLLSHTEHHIHLIPLESCSLNFRYFTVLITHRYSTSNVAISCWSHLTITVVHDQISVTEKKDEGDENKTPLVLLRLSSLVSPAGGYHWPTHQSG